MSKLDNPTHFLFIPSFFPFSSALQFFYCLKFERGMQPFQPNPPPPHSLVFKRTSKPPPPRYIDKPRNIDMPDSYMLYLHIINL